MAMVTNKPKDVWTLGIRLKSKEDYDRLMNDFSEGSDNLFITTGLNYKGLFEGYPDTYPCRVGYLIDVDPLSFWFQGHVKRLVDGGYMVCIEKGDAPEYDE